MQSSTAKSDFEIEVFESDIDHIHFLIRYIPHLSVTSIAGKLKQKQETIIAFGKSTKHIVKELLERTCFLVRWLLRLLYWRSKP